MLIVPLLLTQDEITTPKCISSVWLLSFGFSLTFGSTNAKLYRLYKIFTSRGLVVPRLTNRKLLYLVLTYLVIDTVLLIIYSSVAPPNPEAYPLYIYTDEDLVTGRRELTWTMCTRMINIMNFFEWEEIIHCFFFVSPIFRYFSIPTYAYILRAFHPSSAPLILLAIFKGFVALTGAAMAFSIRAVDRRFTSTAALGWTFYNMAYRLRLPLFF